jgi:hypothetical protein
MADPGFRRQPFDEITHIVQKFIRPRAHSLSATSSELTTLNSLSNAWFVGNSIKFSQAHRAEGAIKPSHPKNATAAPAARSAC